MFRALSYDSSCCFNIETVDPEACPPSDEAIEEIVHHGQKQMLDALGITMFGYQPTEEASKQNVALGSRAKESSSGAGPTYVKDM